MGNLIAGVLLVVGPSLVFYMDARRNETEAMIQNRRDARSQRMGANY